MLVAPSPSRLAFALALAAPAFAWAGQQFFGLQLVPLGLTRWAWVVVFGPMVEEAIFRLLLQAGIYERLRPVRLAGQLANVLTALAFALVHAPQHGIIAVCWVLPALAIGEVWRRGGSWWLCVLLHAWFNISLCWVSGAGWILS